MLYAENESPTLPVFALCLVLVVTDLDEPNGFSDVSPECAAQSFYCVKESRRERFGTSELIDKKMTNDSLQFPPLVQALLFFLFSFFHALQLKTNDLDISW